MQPASPALGERLVDETDEDCLSLNVWTPALDDRRRPVLVWLHGGAFMLGAGSGPTCRGAALARRGDVVVVTINYRLGLFGFLRGIDVCAEALPSTGNEGLFDQLAALTWVKEEIAAFGGDPANVTVFGSSAGALSIELMLAMTRARGLFQKAMMQSGPVFAHTPEDAARVMEVILADVGLSPGEAGRLRDLSAAQLLDIQTRVSPRLARVAYGPVADGTDLPSDPELVIAGGSAAGIPLLVGTNLEEYKFYRRMDGAVETLTDETLLARLADPRTTAARHGVPRQPRTGCAFRAPVPRLAARAILLQNFADCNTATYARAHCPQAHVRLGFDGSRHAALGASHELPPNIRRTPCGSARSSLAPSSSTV
jgi:para-nitrobenzyl esterase